jgi:hypothetical protein
MKRLLASTAIVTLVALPLYAESHEVDNSTASAEQQQSMNDPMMMSGNLEILASTLIGKSVYLPAEGTTVDATDTEVADASQDWERIGEIDNIVLTADGQIKSVTLDAGGFLGVGEKVISTSMDELQFVPDSDEEGEYFVVFNGDRSELPDREEFDQATVEQEGDRMFEGESDVAVADLDEEGESDVASTDMDDEGQSDVVAAEQQRSMDEPMMTSGDLEIRASTLVGKSVYLPAEGSTADMTEAEIADASQDWERIGEIGDLILSGEGEIKSVTLDAGGFLGVGERVISTSMDELQFVPNSDDADDYVVVFSGDPSELPNREEFDQAVLEAEGDRIYDRESDVTVADLDDEGGTTLGERGLETREALSVFTADDLEGMSVYGSDGETVGEVGDIVLTEEGEVHAVVVDVGGFLGIGEKHIAVSLDRLLTDQDSENGELRLTVDHTQEELESMEEWDG